MNYEVYNMQIGKILIAENNGKIIRIETFKENIKLDDLSRKETEVIKQAKMQLEEYFVGKRKDFNIPLEIKGTEFQEKVWKALLEIPYGETRSYLDIAKAVGNPKASRAVGMANNKNKIMIVIPCHRVIGSNKKLVGYAGGLEVKEKLLKIEAENKLHNE